MTYKITSYSYKKAKQLNVVIKPSEKANKKIDIYDKNNNYICSIGAKNYGDYPTFLLTHTQEYANKKRQSFHSRFRRFKDKIGTPAYYALNILW